MAKYFIPILFVFSFYACKDLKTTDPYNYTVVSIESLEEMAREKYDLAPGETIKIYQEIADRSRKIGNHQKSGETNFEIAKIYEEKFVDYANAIKFGKESLVDWEAAKDSKQIVNVQNYLGHIFIMDENFTEGEKSINEATKLSESLSYSQGIADANLNSAKMKYKQGNYEQALSHYKSSKQFWMKDGDQKKIFENNLIGIELYKELGQDKLANKLLRDSKEIARSIDLPKSMMDLFESQVEVADK